MYVCWHAFYRRYIVCRKCFAMEWAPGVQDPSLLAREVQDRAAREDPKLILLCMYDDPTTSMASQTDFIMYDDDPTI